MLDHAQLYDAGVRLQGAMYGLDEYGDKTVFATSTSDADFELLQFFCVARAALNALANRHAEIETAALDAAVQAAS